MITIPYEIKKEKLKYKTALTYKIGREWLESKCSKFFCIVGEEVKDSN